VGPRAGLDGAENLASTGIRSSDHPARSVLLYRLSYSCPSRDKGAGWKGGWEGRRAKLGALEKVKICSPPLRQEGNGPS
jgi:hypothetical protein